MTWHFWIAPNPFAIFHKTPYHHRGPSAPADAVADSKEELSSFPSFGDGKTRLVFVEFEYNEDDEVHPALPGGPAGGGVSPSRAASRSTSRDGSLLGEGGEGGGALSSSAALGAALRAASATTAAVGGPEGGPESGPGGGLVAAGAEPTSPLKASSKQYWMPDRLCKVCWVLGDRASLS